MSMQTYLILLLYRRSHQANFRSAANPMPRVTLRTRLVIASRTIVAYLRPDRSCGNRYISSMVVALHVPRTPEVCRDVSAPALAFVMPSCQLDDGAADMEVIAMDAVVLARNDLDRGPRDGFLSVISGSPFDHFRRRAD